MQRSLIIAAALAAVGASAFAQSSVTVYGRLNVTVERQEVEVGTGSASISSSNTVMQNNSSRWGIKGSEDLGGGMKAGFKIESGFNPATGAANSLFWGRQSEVNLSGGFGTIRLGNFTSEAYFATADYVGMHNHDTGTSSDALYAYLGRDTNKVAYQLPAFGGATLEIATTISSPTQQDTLDVALNYVTGPLHLGAGYQKDGDANQFALRGLYELGALTVGGYVQRSDFPVIGTQSNFRLAVAYGIGKGSLHLDVGRAGDFSNVANTGASQMTVAYNYNLSKRTKVYTFYTKLNLDAIAAESSSLAVGVRHNF